MVAIRFSRGIDTGQFVQSLSDNSTTLDFYSFGQSNGGSDGFRRCHIAQPLTVIRIQLFVQANSQLGNVTWVLRYKQADTPNLITVATLDTGLFTVDTNLQCPDILGNTDYLNFLLTLFDGNGWTIRGYTLLWRRN